MVKETIKKFRESLDYLEEHYDNVQKAWELIKTKCADFEFMRNEEVLSMIEKDVINHDMSKLSKEEFTAYRNYFHPIKGETRDVEAFKKAWQHHLDNNEHHYQNWVNNLATEYNSEAYLIMNIIDWVAMGFKFEDNAEAYYRKYCEQINFPRWADLLAKEIFETIYT